MEKRLDDGYAERIPAGFRIRLRVWARGTAGALATLLAVLPPALLRVVTFGADLPSTKLGARCCHLWGRALCKILGIQVTVTGPVPKGFFLVASNHVSYVDILVLASIYPSCYVAKQEIGTWPFFGWVARSAGTLFVDRDHPRDVVRAGKEMQGRLAAKISLTIFPEGGSSKGESVRPFLPSLLEPAARSGVPCYAAAVGYELVAPGAAPGDIVCWKGRETKFTKHIGRLMREPGIHATVTFAEPVVSSDRKELARLLWERVHAGFRPIRQGAGRAS